MNGSRRVRAPSVLPRSGPSCLFKGHLSTKSNAFCTDSSSLRLSTLHMVKNHMAVHYSKILSAKAVVDCSVPLSMTASIKYADQQRREKLKKELAQCERELKLTKTWVQTNSKNNSKSLFNTLQKPAEEPQNEDDTLTVEVDGYSSFTKSAVTSSERLHLRAPESSRVLTDGAEKNSGSSPSSADYTACAARKTCSGTSSGGGSRGTFPNANQLPLGFAKAPSGDLLDKHSKLFSNRHLPFTPRTLKTEAKSFLSQYRYYTPAKRKKGFADQQIEAETQTELSSFKSDFETAETKDFTDSEANIKQASNYMTYGTKENITPLSLQGNEVEESALQCSAPRAAYQCSVQRPSRRKIYSDEEELLYLSFIEGVTDEILNLGLFSNRSLERLFERHIRQNKHHLEEEKMRHLLHILKVNLGFTSKENSLNLDDIDMLHLPDFEKAEHPVQNKQDASIQQERQEYRKALDMLLSSPKDENEMFSSHDFFLPIYKSKYSEGVIIQQVNDETNPGPSIWDEKNPSTSDSLTDQETSVTVIEGDSDTEKAEPSDELCCLSTALSLPERPHSVQGGSDRDLGEPALRIMEMSIEDGSLDV
ncbi:spermatogenesis-associated protein 7 isoform X2 [Pteronotus mesoamericanus]|uniref:spermatogenesis-associated protein 7 isoform X2 n=1 Tax=Pteronotus mesoamericanus TaxID=1884717 RepID=UPI0023EDB814|nr:spermatogenesis-associated protein 7 isoform X2 [Pteronotus parnellii mesoamericanus]